MCQIPPRLPHSNAQVLHVRQPSSCPPPSPPSEQALRPVGRRWRKQTPSTLHRKVGLAGCQAHGGQRPHPPRCWRPANPDLAVSNASAAAQLAGGALRLASGPARLPTHGLLHYGPAVAYSWPSTKQRCADPTQVLPHWLPCRLPIRPARGT